MPEETVNNAPEQTGVDKITEVRIKIAEMVTSTTEENFVKHLADIEAEARVGKLKKAYEKLDVLEKELKKDDKPDVKAILGGTGQVLQPEGYSQEKVKSLNEKRQKIESAKRAFELALTKGDFSKLDKFIGGGNEKEQK